MATTVITKNDLALCGGQPTVTLTAPKWPVVG